MTKATIGVVLSVLVTASIASADVDFQVTNLVSDQPGVAQITDPNLVNAWGISSSPTSPFWVSDNGTGHVTLYSVVGGVPTKLGLTVTIPGDGSVTGQLFNPGAGGGAFNGDNFLFVSEDGTVSGWRGTLGTSAETLVPASDNVYKGVTYGAPGGLPYVYAANFHTGNIDVFKGNPGNPNLTGNFTDPGLPAGYAPFNIANLNGTLYVAYAQQGPGKDETDGAGLGFVDQFDLQGNFLGRIASQGPLDAPWGLAIAPSGFGTFGGDLLVGSFGDGSINAYSLSGLFEGTLDGTTGSALNLDGLWALKFGNGGNGGDPNVLYFSAGPDDESHGLFGAITLTPEPSSLVVVVGSLPIMAWFRRRRSRQAS